MLIACCCACGCRRRRRCRCCNCLLPLLQLPLATTAAAAAVDSLLQLPAAAAAAAQSLKALLAVSIQSAGLPRLWHWQPGCVQLPGLYVQMQDHRHQPGEALVCHGLSAGQLPSSCREAAHQARVASRRAYVGSLWSLPAELGMAGGPSMRASTPGSRPRATPSHHSKPLATLNVALTSQHSSSSSSSKASLLACAVSSYTAPRGTQPLRCPLPPQRGASSPAPLMHHPFWFDTHALHPAPILPTPNTPI